MADSSTPNKGLILEQTGNNVGTWGQKLNDNCISILDNNLGGNLTLSVAGNSDVTLSAAQAENLCYSFTGVLTGNINVIWPTGAGLYVINNATTGSYTLTVKPLGGTGVVVTQGNTAEVFISTNTTTAVITNTIFAPIASPTFTGPSSFTGNLGIGGAASGTYALNVVQAGASQAYFGSTGAHQATITIDNAIGGNLSVLSFADAGTSKWTILKTAGNNLSIVDVANSKTFLSAMANSSLTLGAAQNFVISSTGAATTITQSQGDNSTKIATTAYVDTAVGAGTGAIKSVKTQTFAASGTYTPSTGMAYCVAEVWGAGGGGGGVTATGSAAAGGGGAGGYVKKTITASSIGVSKAVTIGTGGTAGSNSGGTGGTGGTSSLGSIISATGGAGGVGSTTGAGGAFSGGAGGVGSSGDINATGQPGGASVSQGTAAKAISGFGGSTSLGGGGIAQAGTGSNGATAATNSGSGGGGAFSNGSAQTGGVGGDGFVIITEYCTQ